MYKMDDNRIREIIREEVDAMKFFDGINRSNGGLTPWNPETKMDRMQPTNASRAKKLPTNDFKIHSYQDWIRNYKSKGISYGEYMKMDL